MTRAVLPELQDRAVIATSRQLDEALGRRKTLLLSATVPRKIENEERVELGEGETMASLNERHASVVRATRIRDAASAMTRAALSHGYRLVCRAHPSITLLRLRSYSLVAHRIMMDITQGGHP